MTISLYLSHQFQVSGLFLRKFQPTSVRFRNLKISWKSVRKCEISRKSVPENGSEIENRKSPKILADRPSEITRWLPLYQYYKAFLQSFYRRLSGRKQPVGGDSSKRQFYQLLCMILDQKPTIPIILDCEQSLRMVTRARKSSEAIESKKQEAEGNHFVLLRLVCPPYNLIAL